MSIARGRTVGGKHQALVKIKTAPDVSSGRGGPATAMFFSGAFLTRSLQRGTSVCDLWKDRGKRWEPFFLLSPHHTLLNCRGVPVRPLTTAVRREVRASNRSGRSSVRNGTWMVKTSRIGLIRREARVPPTHHVRWALGGGGKGEPSETLMEWAQA